MKENIYEVIQDIEIGVSKLNSKMSSLETEVAAISQILKNEAYFMHLYYKELPKKPKSSEEGDPSLELNGQIMIPEN